jgi:hypothetical protein
VRDDRAGRVQGLSHPLRHAEHRHGHRRAPGPGQRPARQYTFRSWCKQNIEAKGKAADEDYWGSPYAYLCGQDSFKIFSDGPDRTPQTADDLEEGFAIVRKAAPDINIGQ